MAAMTTALTEFSDKENSRTYTRSGHTVLQPKLVIQKRKVPTDINGSASMSIAVIDGTTDADGNPLAAKVVAEVNLRYPAAAQQAELDDVKAALLDIVAGDEFDNSFNTFEYLI